jgi:hypothetical protein
MSKVMFSLEHRLRIACAGLAGKKRAETMLVLRMHPERLEAALRDRMKSFAPRPRKPRPIKLDRNTNIAVRLSMAEYLLIKGNAKENDQTISEYIREKCCVLPKDL